MKEINDEFIYQAIGWIKCTVLEEVVEDRTKIDIGGKVFTLFLKKKFLNKIHLHQECWLKVHPQYHFGTKGFTFSLVKVLEEKPEDISIPNIFVFKGVYELIKWKDEEEKNPSFVIYRNFYGGDLRTKLSYLKNQKLTSLIPLKMEGRVPFDRESGDNEHRLYYQILARFDPETETFYFLRDISEPSKKKPKGLKQSDLGLVLKYSNKKNKNAEIKLENDSIVTIAKEVVMIDGKTPEISIKFDQKPVVPADGKQVEIQINSDLGIKVKALVKRKTLKKLVEKMDSYELWIGSLSGKIKEIHPDGVIELEGAGIQVFEKKQKKKEEESQELEEVV